MPSTHPTHRPRWSPERRIRLVLAVLLAVGLAVALPFLLPRLGNHGPDRPSRLTVATWNMCGVRAWHCAGTGSHEDKVEMLLGLARHSDARVIMVQEACADDVAEARRRLGSSWRDAFHAYEYRGADGRETPARCASPRSDEAGYAILSSSGLTGVRHFASAQPEEGLQRGILCATQSRYEVRVCTAHLTPRGGDKAHPYWEYRDDQLRTLVAAARGPRTVYGGDLNALPPGPENPFTWVWPSDGPYRSARECDQRSPASRAAPATHRSGHKIDYLFTPLPRLGCSVRPTRDSDHEALVMRVDTA